MRVNIPVRLNCYSEPVSYAVVEESCTGGLVIKVFDDSGKVGTDVLLCGCPQCCMPTPVEGLLQIYEDMVEVLLVLETFLTKGSYAEDLKCSQKKDFTCFT